MGRFGGGEAASASLQGRVRLSITVSGQSWFQEWPSGTKRRTLLRQQGPLEDGH